MTTPADEPAAKPAGANRSSARLNAVQALYQWDISGTPTAFLISEFIEHRLGREIDGTRYKSADAAFFSDVVEGVSARKDTIDAAIAAALPPQWPLMRLETLIRAIFRAGAYELMARPDIPTAVVIDEYVDVTHAFFSGSEPAFVNGVLDAVARRVRSGPEGQGANGG